MKDDNLVIFIIPYFGALPNTFPLFLETCKYNPQYNWLMFLDDQREFQYPDNVEVVYTSFDQIKERIRACFDFPVSLSSPKKLCDFKPAYGYIFEDECRGYKYWGYCDIDIVLGDINQFLPESVLSMYQKHFYLGHMSIYENSLEMRTLFMKGNPRKENSSMKFGYLDVLGNNANMVFDEWSDQVETVNEVAETMGVSINTVFPMLDIRPWRSRFYSTVFDASTHSWIHNPDDNYVVVWDKGKLFAYSLENGEIKREEVLYAHFQKRKMAMKKTQLTKNHNSLLFYPNRIIACEKATNKMIIRKIRLSRIRSWLFVDEICKYMQDLLRLWIHRFNEYVLHKK